jgi:hypothetical protein
MMKNLNQTNQQNKILTVCKKRQNRAAAEAPETTPKRPERNVKFRKESNKIKPMC